MSGNFSNLQSLVTTTKSSLTSVTPAKNFLNRLDFISIVVICAIVAICFAICVLVGCRRRKRHPSPRDTVDARSSSGNNNFRAVLLITFKNDRAIVSINSFNMAALNESFVCSAWIVKRWGGGVEQCFEGWCGGSTPHQFEPCLYGIKLKKFLSWVWSLGKRIKSRNGTGYRLDFGFLVKSGINLNSVPR